MRFTATLSYKYCTPQMKHHRITVKRICHFVSQMVLYLRQTWGPLYSVLVYWPIFPVLLYCVRVQFCYNQTAENKEFIT
jgi:hypothetical protein